MVMWGIPLLFITGADCMFTSQCTVFTVQYYSPISVHSLDERITLSRIMNELCSKAVKGDISCWGYYREISSSTFIHKYWSGGRRHFTLLPHSFIARRYKLNDACGVGKKYLGHTKIEFRATISHLMTNKNGEPWHHIMYVIPVWLGLCTFIFGLCYRLLPSAHISEHKYV